MIETQQGYAVGTHLATLAATITGSSTTDTDAITRIESKLDVALGQTSATPLTPTQNTTTNAQRVEAVSRATTDPHKALGMCRKTGKRLSSVDHLKQSITIILTTLLESRVMRREFGSSLFQWIDQPQNYHTRVHIIAVIASALDQWEPRFTLKRVAIAASKEKQKAGRLYIKLLGSYRNKDIEMGVLA